MTNKRLQKFLFPDLNQKFLIRILVVGVTAFILFKYILIPFRISGFSMVPTYNDGSVNFSFTLKYLFTPPKRFDVVTVRFAGNHVMLLKRIVALEGETIEFKKGFLFINGKKMHEPYVSKRQPWDLAPRTVKKDHVYVVGDNRNVSMERHHFGQTPINRITGVPLW
ncbi:MAG: signal peptidase I [Desulfobacteraceae bacterium]|jgi:signal peptidase I|nr:signal peptidase I [Desulfobacteraceae bacterium]